MTITDIENCFKISILSTLTQKKLKQTSENKTFRTRQKENLKPNAKCSFKRLLYYETI